jgi:hypothetical protein
MAFSTTWSVAAVGGLVLAGIILTGSAGQAVAANFDGTKPLICAVTTIQECDAGQCDRYAPEGTVAGAPSFIKFDVNTKAVTASFGRKSTLNSTMHLNGRLVLQGGEAGRGWSATIDEDTGIMSAAVVDNDHTFSLFGACTTP